MDAFKRAILLGAQASLQQVTQAEVQAELQTLIPQMQADPESQPQSAQAAEDQPTQGYQQPQY
jgi:hypothetical protein